MTIEITDAEVISSQCLYPEQLMLFLLQKRGAPIRGTFFLYPNPNYRVTRIDEHGKSVFTFEDMTPIQKPTEGGSV